MKVSVTEMFDFPPETIFEVLTDIPHHVDWVDEPVELVSLMDGPAKLGTKWEQNADRSGRKLVTLNMCNIYEKNRKFGWKSEKPFAIQVTLTLEPDQDSTKLAWAVESEEAGPYTKKLTVENGLVGKTSLFFCRKMDKMEVKLPLGRPTINLRIWWLRVRPAPGLL